MNIFTQAGSAAPYRRRLAFCWTLGWLGLLGLGSGRPAQALQPLEAFLSSAMQHHPDSLQAIAERDSQAANENIAWGKVLPGVDLAGSYKRNQYQVDPALSLAPNAPPVNLLITPYNQWDGSFSLKVPLVDLSNWVRLHAARQSSRVAQLQVLQNRLELQARVVQTYYQLVANVALVEASQQALEVAQANLALSRVRLQAGNATALDADRAEADMERQVQQLAQANLGVALSQQQLQSLSDVSPDLSSRASLPDDLSPAEPLSHYQKRDTLLPSVAAATLQASQTAHLATAQWLTLLPSLSGVANEHLTNALGFVGRDAFYTLELDLTWKFDFGSVGQIQLAQASQQRTQAAAKRAQLAGHDAIYNNWHTVQAGLAQSRSAQAEARIRRAAATLARERYQAGVATQLDWLQAQRDAFVADVNVIQATANLINARLQLRLAAGFDILSTQASSAQELF